MRLRLRRPIQALDSVYARRAVPQAQLDTFRQALARLFSRIDEHESEEYQKTILASFFREAFGSEQESPFTVDVREPIDLIIRVNSAGSAGDMSSPGALIETRRVFAADMMTMLKNNVRALHELILYAFGSSQHDQPLGVRQFVITDAYNWFIFDKADFQTVFLDNPRLIRVYQLSQQPAKGAAFFYVEAARILRELDQDVPVTYLNLREAADWLTLPPSTGDNLLLPVYKLLSPEHLLGLPTTTDNTTVRQRFYGELLHLLGLTEVRPGRNRPALVQRRPEEDRQPGSLLDLTIHELKVRNVLAALPNQTVYGRNEDEQLFTLGLLLCFTWIGRLLFIKLFEAQIGHYQPGEDDASRSVTQSIRTFADLNELFFDVLPVPVDQRSQDRRQRFGGFPPIRVDLFKPTDAELHSITIADLPDQSDLALAAQSVLTDAPTSTLSYLLNFLNAYAFETEARPVVQTDTRPQLTITDLGLVFDRFVSGLSGSALVPPLITSWVVHETLRNAALSRFNAHFGWTCESVSELSDKLESISVADANAIFNSLRIVDPAVSSGSFLIQALNQLIALKAELGILIDRQYRPLAHYTLSLAGQDLFIMHEDGEPFQYRPATPGPLAHPPSPEGQRVQETIFLEKAGILNNCLFGTDTNPITVFTTQLCLWFELLKSLPYDDGQTTSRIGQKNTSGKSPTNKAFPVMPSFPALTTIRQGNPLISRYGPAFQIDTIRPLATREKFQSMLTQYRTDILTYKNERTSDVQEQLDTFRAFVDQVFQSGQPASATIRQLETKLSKSALTFDFAGQTDKTQRLAQQLAAKKQRFADHQRLFAQAIDWRFTFPDVLDNDGNYTGFDVVLGAFLNPAQYISGDYRAILKKAFPNTFGHGVNHYALFVELGMQLLRPNGQLAFVLPDRWLRTRQSLPFRQWLRTKDLDWLIRFDKDDTNNRQTTQATILIARNHPTTDSVRTAHFNVTSLKQTEHALKRLITYLDRNAVAVSVDSLPDAEWIDFPA